MAWMHGTIRPCGSAPNRRYIPQRPPCTGDLVGRLIAARLGRSSKCLVLDLDNTLWGGVIGDDGLNGITLGQGSARGEAFVSFQITFSISRGAG